MVFGVGIGGEKISNATTSASYIQFASQRISRVRRRRTHSRANGTFFFCQSENHYKGILRTHEAKINFFIRSEISCAFFCCPTIKISISLAFFARFAIL